MVRLGRYEGGALSVKDLLEVVMGVQGVLQQYTPVHTGKKL